MKILWRIVVPIFAILLVAISIAWYIFGHYDAGAPPISSPKALSLLNNCYRFTHAGAGTRQAIAITRVAKGGGGADASSNMDTAEIRWRWVSGPEVQKGEEQAGKAVFGWKPLPGLSDWNFPESQWGIVQYELPGDASSFDCAPQP